MIGGVATDAGSDAMGKTAAISGEAAGAFVSIIKVEQVNSYDCYININPVATDKMM